MTPPAASHNLPAQRAIPIGFERCSAAQTESARTLFVVDSIGHLVPPARFAGRVHSVFAQACNLACGDTLLTICAFGAGNGPTTLRLARDAPGDLRDHFEIGEPVDASSGSPRTRRVELALLHASVWRPAKAGPSQPTARIEANLRNAERRLNERRATYRNVLDAAGAPVIAALGDACRALDRECAERAVGRLLGWGEGLTPAGDDFLVGLSAGLDALVRGDGRRRRFRRALATAVVSRTERTTPIAAHCLRLAAAGHYPEPLLDLRNALLSASDDVTVEAALRRAVAVGSSSGADTVSGLLAGLLAWLPATSSVAA